MATLTKDSTVDKVNQAEVLQQVVLNGCARYEHSSLGRHFIQALVRLVVRVLQTMTLFTNFSVDVFNFAKVEE